MVTYVFLGIYVPFKLSDCLMHSFSQYSFITLFISTTYVSGDISSLISDFNYLSLFSVNRLAKSLSVLLILSKNQLLVSLIFYSIFQSLFH